MDEELFGGQPKDDLGGSLVGGGDQLYGEGDVTRGGNQPKYGTVGGEGEWTKTHMLGGDVVNDDQPKNGLLGGMVRDGFKDQLVQSYDNQPKERLYRGMVRGGFNDQLVQSDEVHDDQPKDGQYGERW